MRRRRGHRPRGHGRRLGPLCRRGGSRGREEGERKGGEPCVAAASTCARRRGHRVCLADDDARHGQPVDGRHDHHRPGVIGGPITMHPRATFFLRSRLIPPLYVCFRL